MEIRQMRYFIEVAEQGSLASAASEIGIAQPSLSQQVKNLEERIGTELLIRSSRGVTLTEAGATFLEHAKKILSNVDVAMEDVRLAGTEPTGMVVFGFPSSVSMVLSVPLVETIRNDYPQIRFRAVDAMSGFIKDWVDDQSIDLAILYDTNNLRSSQSKLLLNEDMYFYSAKDNWPFDTPPGCPVPMEKLKTVELVLPSKSHGLRILIDRFCKSSGKTLNVVVEMDSLTQIKSLVSRGSASTILAPAAAYDFENQGELVSAPIVEPTIRRSVYLVRNPDKVLKRASREVQKLTVSVVKELVERDIWKGEFCAK
ncbi:LysR family transcriptional regulator [Hoeflea prorocentri]|uniref:LysR family transcriptional regulator n=1 Tax=Hoeflea prorocentri TaxID=1922333 RepID=A0A9X3ZFG3_9HYPH|nr:LysR family transcriptional regulator [Hoeflea prorocentri]MCY6379647.1 LysR family transcriptional regulator [Hoeflea prorocentri]MDA5397447.1 LysR family transcriptional regulator [Hoeflea prorocentri]